MSKQVFLSITLCLIFFNGYAQRTKSTERLDSVLVSKPTKIENEFDELFRNKA